MPTRNSSKSAVRSKRSSESKKGSKGSKGSKESKGSKRSKGSEKSTGEVGSDIRAEDYLSGEIHSIDDGTHQSTFTGDAVGTSSDVPVG